MRQEKQLLRLAVCLLLGLLLHGPAVAKRPGGSPVQVFVLAGQSNMQGQGVVDLDHPQYYNGGKGTLLRVLQNTKTPDRYAHLQDDRGSWVVRDDVHVRFRVKDGDVEEAVKKGGLSIGFAGYPGRHHIGPEYQFGHVVGDHYDQPVVLIKTAWGGKSLYKDFRPPSAGGETGEYYTKMLGEVKEAISNLHTDFPHLAGRKHELAGFVWQQGWNDMFNEQALEQYEDNLVYLVQDVREAWGEPRLPVVIGELGNGGDKVGQNMLTLRQAQAAAAERKELKGNVAFVKTTAFARPADQSPNVGHGHHWFGNAESYFLIGDALGEKMLELVSRRR